MELSESSSSEDDEDDDYDSGDSERSSEEEDVRQHTPAAKSRPVMSQRPSHPANSSSRRRPPPGSVDLPAQDNPKSPRKHWSPPGGGTSSSARDSSLNNTPAPNPRRTSRQSSRQPAGGSSAPSYGDAASPSASGDNYSHLPTPPSNRQSAQQWPTQDQDRPARPLSKHNSVQVHRPRRPRTQTLPAGLENQQMSSFSEDSSTMTYPSSSSATRTTTRTPSGSRPVPPKRNKTVREPVGAPVQAIVPRAPRAVAAARIDDSDEYGDEDEIDVATGLPQIVEPVQAQNLVAGGKNAKLAVELKLDLEIEIELKAYIHGDVTLELFN